MIKQLQKITEKKSYITFALIIACLLIPYGIYISSWNIIVLGILIIGIQLIKVHYNKSIEKVYGNI